ncbi:MAG: Gfo/Idh/MocA family oxidoreductase [Chloroflexi bacterium]|nr:Gfo/Idh/MocA family oxidoreductase [Chloroflexota bacterium]MCL5273667.1 Gfo/Idh/MocA family oxidoreductase [Chloroflexota bacterium]
MEPIKTALVGIGRAGWNMHCEELDKRADKFTIVAACDVVPDRQRRMAERYRCRAYGDIRELVKDNEAELVSIATRSPDHVAHAILALEAGKHVFLEKPIALDYAGALRLRDAAVSARGNLYFRHNRRFEPAFNHIRELLASGILGNVFEVKLRRNSYQRRSDWQTLLASGGGLLNNWGPHIVDHALQFLGAPLVDLWSDLKRIAAAGDAEDHLKIVLRGANGRVVDMEISGGAALPEPEYTIFGDRGALVCQGDVMTLRYLPLDYVLPELHASAETPGLEYSFGKGGELPWVNEMIRVQPSVPTEMDDIWDHLYAAIRDGAPFPVTMEQALEVIRVIELAKRGTPFIFKG